MTVTNSWASFTGIAGPTGSGYTLVFLPGIHLGQITLLTLIGLIAGLPLLFKRKLGDGRYFIFFWLFFFLSGFQRPWWQIHALLHRGPTGSPDYAALECSLRDTGLLNV